MAAISVTAANVLAATGARISHGTSGGTITAGMPVYRDVSDSNKLKACRANAVGTANCHGISLHAASAGQPLAYLPTGYNITIGGTVVVGEIYCVSDAVAGQIVPVSDLGSADYQTPLGVATTTAIIALNIINSGIAKA
jgi:Tfp pilus assembly protein FimT